MPTIPPVILKRLYVKGSLKPEEDGLSLALKNTIAPGTIVRFEGLELDGQPIPLERVTVVVEGEERAATSITADDPLSFSLGTTFTLHVTGVPLESGQHKMKIRVVVQDVGLLEIPVVDRVA
ncbi:MAG TPA: hypothetical protein G4O00_02660 [Thermoflexia bacterium]|jgi:hydroxymethylglutaryl-CoA reductase (NADPH)|nr:hypothetical protein [Thermoflexia bacterium]